MAEGGKGRLFTGARARFLIQGKKVGYATGVSGSREIQWDPAEVLDNIRVEEHAPTAYRCSLNATKFRIVGETLTSLGYMPKTGTSPKEHLTNILNSGEMKATIEDSKTGKNLYIVTGVRIASDNFQVNARGIVGEDVNFVCLVIEDEGETA